MAGWLQLNFALVRGPAGPAASARRLFARLEESRYAGRYFFQRKPPDLRVRVWAEEPRAAFSELWPLLKAARADGLVERFFRSVYEPEEYLFGGARASERVHRLFLADTSAWVAVDQRREDRDPPALARMPAPSLAFAVIGDLYARAIAERTEIWDAWCRLEALVRAYGAPERQLDLPIPELAELAADTGELTARALTLWTAAHADAAESLRALEREGALRAGLRGVLTQAALFIANRHGLDGAVTRALASRQIARLDPEQALRSARNLD